jgi:Spy/CpxP family protein refolding chaperone
MPYEFWEHANLTPAQVQQLHGIEHDQNNPMPIAFGHVPIGFRLHRGRGDVIELRDPLPTATLTFDDRATEANPNASYNQRLALIVGVCGG